MPQKLLTLPLRLGFGVARTAFGISTRLAVTAIDLVRPGSSSPAPAPPRPQPSEASQRQPPAAPEHRDPRSNGRSEAPAPPAPPAPRTPPQPSRPVTPPSELPDTPLSAEQAVVKTIDDADEVVGEFAEVGAEDGAGAQLAIEEPWEGYASMKADAIIARIAEADAAELAVIELYEGLHKRRQRVLAAAAKRLRSISRPV